MHAYKIFFGNTHAHCFYSGDASQTPDNSPANHFNTAAAEGYDFYAVTDHSQYEQYTTEAWDEIAAAAVNTTTSSFVALRGFEYSENNGPGAKGHLNTYCSSSYLNALADGIDMKYYQDWLSSGQNKDVVVSMNHPGLHQYEDFACYNEDARKKITMLEVINGTGDHYDAFCRALAKGWKVSPVAGCDNHGVNKIRTWQPRTGIAADNLSADSILDAMRNRRTYATYDKNLEAVYYVDNFVMGTEFAPEASVLHFCIFAEDPDISDASARITKMEIVGENGNVVASKNFSNHKVSWETDIERGKQRYFYVTIYNSSSASLPVAFMAPVWIK